MKNVLSLALLQISVISWWHNEITEGRAAIGHAVT